MGYIRNKRSANGFPVRLTDVYGNVPAFRVEDPGIIRDGKLTFDDRYACSNCGFHVCGCAAKEVRPRFPKWMPGVVVEPPADVPSVDEIVSEVAKEIRKHASHDESGYFPDRRYAESRGWSRKIIDQEEAFTKGVYHVGRNGYGLWCMVEIYSSQLLTPDGGCSLRACVDLADSLTKRETKEQDPESYARERGWVWHPEAEGRLGRWSWSDAAHVYCHDADRWFTRTGTWNPHGKHRTSSYYLTMREAIDAAVVGDAMVRPGDPSFELHAGSENGSVSTPAGQPTTDESYARAHGWVFRPADKDTIGCWSLGKFQHAFDWADIDGGWLFAVDDWHALTVVGTDPGVRLHFKTLRQIVDHVAQP